MIFKPPYSSAGFLNSARGFWVTASVSWEGVRTWETWGLKSLGEDSSLVHSE